MCQNFPLFAISKGCGTAHSISLSVGPEANPVLPVQAKKLDPVESLSRRNLAIRGGMPVWWMGSQEASLGRFFLNVFYLSCARHTRTYWYLRSTIEVFFIAVHLHTQLLSSCILTGSGACISVSVAWKWFDDALHFCCSFSQQSGSASPLRIHFAAFARVVRLTHKTRTCLCSSGLLTFLVPVPGPAVQKWLWW